MSKLVDIKVLKDYWGYWNGKTTELLKKGDIRKNVDKGTAERAAARHEVEIVTEMHKPRAAETVETAENTVKDLQSMTIAELKKIADQRGIDLEDAKKKADILKKIEG